MQLRTLSLNALAVAATGVLGGLASRPAQSAWYASLKKPAYQPPRQAFPIVWPILYADIAAVSASTIDDLDARHENDNKRAYTAALAANLVLNAGWSWLFFTSSCVIGSGFVCPMKGLKPQPAVSVRIW